MPRHAGAAIGAGSRLGGVGLWARAKGGYYYDGRYPNLLAVVDHYNSCFNRGLNSGQKADLVKFLKSR